MSRMFMFLVCVLCFVCVAFAETVAISTGTPVGIVGSILVMLNGALGGGLLAIIVKFVIDGLKKILPQTDWAKRLYPVLAPIAAIIIWAVYQWLTGIGNFASLLSFGIMGGLGAIGLHEIVNTAIAGKVSKTVVMTENK